MLISRPRKSSGIGICDDARDRCHLPDWLASHRAQEAEVNASRTKLAALLAGVTAASLLGGIDPALARDGSAPSAGALHLTAVIGQERDLDAAPAGRSPGDEQVASGTLYDRARRAIGSFGFTCTTVGVATGSGLELCAGFGALPDGQIEVQGESLSTDRTHLWAVTGGTGGYTTARGALRIEDRSDTVDAVTLVLR
jgi:hypothetical protein